jgi:hypothetical protein
VDVPLTIAGLRAMRPRQLAGRSRRLVPVPALARAAGRGAPPPVQHLAADLGCSPAPQSGPHVPPHESGSFAGYGSERQVRLPDFWERDDEGLLFLFHLHGFSDLAEYARGSRSQAGDRFWATVLEDWLETQSTPRLPAWHPYPTSVRIVSWCAAVAIAGHWPDRLVRRLTQSLWAQARYLRLAVEHDVGGNHVLKNATALAFAGSLFPSSGLLERALRLLLRELADQVLADGGHVERSSSYQREILADLEDVRELLRRGGRPVPAELDVACARMGAWLEAVAGPDRRLPLLNDAWEGPPLRDRTREDVTLLAASGHVALRHRDDQLLFDAGPLCARHLPPHAHADALSFVLWLDGKPLVVDPGSHAYTGPSRDRFRGTAAHNTVEVGGRDQCDFWGDFRAVHLPQVAEPRIERSGELVVVSSRHDGYSGQRGGVEHERSIVWWPGRGVVVLDRLLGGGARAARSRLSFAPGLEAQAGRIGPVEVEALNGSAVWGRGDYSPGLGRVQSCAVLDQACWPSPGQPFGWSLLRPGTAIVALDEQTIALQDGGGRVEASAFPGSGALRG